MSTSDSYCLQKERPESAEREAWNERERETERERESEKDGLHKRMNFPFQKYRTTFLHTGS
jgi:hypothetical protein